MEIKEVKDYLKNKYPKFKGFIEHTIVAEMALNFAKEHYTKQLSISHVVDSEAELCGKPNCNRQKLDNSPLCSYHWDIANS